MRKADLFDEIIFCMKEFSEREPTAEISPELLDRLMSDLPQNTPVPAYVPPEPVPARENVVSVPPATPVSAAPSVVSAPPAPASLRPDCSWDELRAAAGSCRKCGLCETRTNVVFGSGNPQADLMFIGEGPGESEDLAGLPFVGRAGELLTRMIAAMGFDREKDVYIANIVKCRPPGNRNPEEQEAQACLPYLKRQIELVQPKVIVLLGSIPFLYLLNQRGITRLHGQWFNYNGIRTLPTYHPAFLLRQPEKKADAWHDLQIVMREFGHEVRPRKR